MSTITTRAGKGSPLTNNEVDANFTNLNTDKAELSGAAFTGAITTTSTVDGRDVAADGTKLDTVETNADVTDTTNVTAAGALMDSEVTNLAQVKAFDSADYATAAQGTTADAALPRTGGAMTGAITTNSTFDGRDVATDGTKLDGIEAGADVTDTANVTAAGALMDSELTSEASVKALNQGVATTDSPTFAALTSTGEITANGGIALGDNDKAKFGASDDLQIYHDGSNSIVADVGTGHLKLLGNDLRINNADSSKSYFSATNGGSAILYYDAAAKLATTSTGIDVTGTATMDVLDASGTGVHDLQRSHPTTTASLAVLDLKAKSTGDMAAGFGTAARFIIEDTANVENVVAEIAARRESSDLTAALTFTTLVKERMRIASNGDISFYEDTGTTPKFFWDASAESLGIGTSSPSAKLEVVTASPTQSRFAYNSTNYVEVNYDGFNVVGGSMVFENAGSEKMRIDSSGNVLVGTTSTAVSSSTGSVTGTVINSSGLFEAAKTGTIMELNRLSADGTILNFRKDGTTVGSIGSYLGAYAYIGSTSGTDTHIGFVNGSVRPATATGAALDATLDLGNSSGRFKDLYLSGGVKNSSSIYMGRTDLNTSVWVGNSTINAGDSSGAVRDAAVDLGYSSGRWKDAYLSGGVYLGGTGAANKLDDYEEGTWTPTFLYLTGVSSATGSYVKVGNLVTVSVAITSSGTTVITLNSSRISNLPFTVGTSGGGRYTGSFTDVNTSSGDYGIHTLSGTQAIFTSSVSTGNVIAGSFTYRAA